MSETAAFDVLAAGYDVSFSQSLTGSAQRKASRHWLQAFLKGKGYLRILEINCGTGDDAWWLASLGHTVTATDQSAAMIHEAMRKSFETERGDEQHDGQEVNPNRVNKEKRLAEEPPQLPLEPHRAAETKEAQHATITGGSGTYTVREGKEPPVKTAGTQERRAPHFQVCGFDELGQRFAGEQFDLVFSNFAGLNCITPAQLQALDNHLQSLLGANGHVAAVIFGKYCWWETCYYLMKGGLKQAFRRWNGKPVQARLSDGVSVPIHYYSAKRFAKSLRSFSLRDKKPVGLFVPPSYLEPQMRRHPSLLNGLARMERWLRRLPMCSALADHTYVLLKKRTA